MRMRAVFFCSLVLVMSGSCALGQAAARAGDATNLRTRLAEPGPASVGTRAVDPTQTPQLRDAPSDIETAKTAQMLAPPLAPVAPQGPPPLGDQGLIGNSAGAAPLPLGVSGAATGRACRQTCAAERFQCLATANGPCDSTWASCVIACNLPRAPR